MSHDDNTLQNNGQFDEIYEQMVALRIACPQFGYPICEARYASVEEYERETGEKF